MYIYIPYIIKSRTVRIAPSDHTPLCTAATQGHCDVVRLLWEADAHEDLSATLVLRILDISDQPVDFVEHIRMMYAYRLSEMWLDVEDH